MTNTTARFETSRRLAWLLCCVVPFVFGGFALALGQDANWDLKNYHWYNPYALLTGRWQFDLSPASYYNPAIDVPMYLAAQALSAKTLTFGLGVVHGLNFILLFVLARTVLRSPDEVRRTLAAAVIAFVGLIGGGHLGIVGTTFGDNVISLFVLTSVVIVAQKPKTLFSPDSRIALAGLVMGVAVGLKLPMGIFAVGFCLAFLFIGGAVRLRFLLAFMYGVGVVGGLTLSAGYWFWMMARDFGNPLFPYFNGLFGSPMGLADSYRDVRFVPKDFFTAVLFPFLFSLDGKRVGEIVFRDFRIATAYALWIVTAIMLFARRSASTSVVEPTLSRYLALASLVTLVVWTPLFAVYRYIIPLEMLAPVLIVAAVGQWPTTVRTRAIITSVALLLVTASALPGTWTRQTTWTRQLVEVTVPPFADPTHSMVLMVGYEPASYVIPAFPPQIPFLRIQGYFNDPDDDTGFNRVVHERVAAHGGDLYLLFATWEQGKAARALSRYNLSTDFDQCVNLVTNLSEGLKLCALSRNP